MGPFPVTLVARIFGLGYGDQVRLMKRRMTLLVLFLLFSRTDAFCFTGEVVGILAAGTLEVVRNGKTERIGLQGIDCPELSQPYGNEAKQATSDLAFARKVTIEPYGKDKYGRVMAEVQLTDGTNINHELVKAGWCWWSRKLAPNNAALEQLELEAKAAQKGLWVDPAPIPPWEYRKARRRP